MKKIKHYKQQKEEQMKKGIYFVPDTQLSSPVFTGKEWISPAESPPSPTQPTPPIVGVNL